MVLRAKDIMDANVLRVDGDVDAFTAAQGMVQRRKGYALVTSGNPPRVTGIVTEWDYLEKVVAPGLSPASVKMQQIASAVVHTCAPDTPTDEVASTMSRLGVRRLVVRSGDEVVGVVTSRHVLSAFRQYVDQLSSEIAGFQGAQGPLG